MQQALKQTLLRTNQFDRIDVNLLHAAFVFLWLGLLLYVPVNNYNHVGSVSSPNHTFVLDMHLTSTSCTYFRLKPDGRRMVIEIISRSISTNVWDGAGINLTTPGSADRFASVARHVIDCACCPGIHLFSSAHFFKINVHERYFSVNQFRFRSGPTDTGPNCLQMLSALFENRCW